MGDGRGRPRRRRLPSKQERPRAKKAASQSLRVHAAGGLALVVEPAAGPEPVYALLRSARRSVDVAIYELEDDQATALLAADAARGVRVRVLLDGHYVRRYNAPAYSYLRSHGVRVRWAPSHFDVAHEKAIVVDRRRAAVMTMNLTARYYSSSRDFVVFDRDRADVAAIDATFNDDWVNGGLPPASPADLVWSPGAQDALVTLIASARHELLIENEEMNDEIVVHALQAAARRGVRVEVVMTRQSDWASAFSTLARTGVAVRTYSRLGAPLHPRQGDRRRPRHSARPGVPGLTELLGRLTPLRPRARHHHDPARAHRRRRHDHPSRRRRRRGLAAVKLSTKPCKWASCR